MKTHTLEFREVDRARFEEIRSGSKSIETRAATEKYREIERGDVVLFQCGADSFSKTIVKKYHWPTIEAMVAEVPIKKIMPLLDTAEQVRDRYATYPGYLEKIEKLGILGFELA